MKLSKFLLVSLLTLFMCSGLFPPTTDAAEPVYSLKIVVFHEGVSLGNINQYVQEWENFGVEMVRSFPSINARVLRVPGHISSSELADDPRVENVEDNQEVGIQSLSAAADGGAADGGAADGGAADGGAADGGAADGGAADGGAADGGAADGGAADGGALNSPPWWSFIRPVPKPPEDHRARGVLRMHDQMRDPELLTDYFDSSSIQRIIPYAHWLVKKRKIKIAVLDTGIDAKHPDLADCVKGGYNVYTDKHGPAADDNGHGTHIAGIVCSRIGDDPFGLIPKTEIYAVKVLNQYAGGDIINILVGLEWSLNNGMHLVNMSLSYRHDSFALRKKIQQAYENGLIMVAAAGNHSNWDDPAPNAAADGGAADGGAADGGAADGGAADGGAADGGAADGGAADGGAADGGAADGGAADGGAADGVAADGGAGYADNEIERHSVMFPARYPQVIAVGASTPFNEIAQFTNTSDELDVTAPGIDVVSTNVWKWGGYGVCSGTSMASAHVTGTVAMMLALNPTLSGEQVRQILKDTAHDLQDYDAGDVNLVDSLKKSWHMWLVDKISNKHFDIDETNEDYLKIDKFKKTWKKWNGKLKKR
jgi:subtilisin family serine protease